jgi:phosphatidylglycerol:prolipoprotein diacylglycerol transferase
MYQVLFRIPIKTEWFPDGLPIYGFGVMLFVAFVLCSWLAGRRAEKDGVKKEYIQDLIVYLFIGGLLGARISYLIMQDHVYDFWELLYRLPRIWDGGIILYGSLVGGFLGYLVYYFLVLRKAGVATSKIADILAPSLALGIALGRLGCFCNGCCYGQVPAVEAPVVAVSFPLSAAPTQELVLQGVQTAAGFTVAPPQLQPLGGVLIDQVDPASPAYAAGLRAGQVIERVGGRLVRSPEELTMALFNPDQWPRGQRTLTLSVRGEPEPMAYVPCSLGLHPTQIYETISMFLLFLLLQAYYPFRTRDGQVMALMMMCYAIHRSLNELLRSDARPVGFERYGSVILLACGVLLMAWLYLRRPQYRLRWDEPPATTPGTV